jgi:Skp family chaperone for outer membrane proteins
MKTLIKIIASAAVVSAVVTGATAAVAAPAAAPAGGVNGIAIANFDNVVVNSQAFKVAQAQRDGQFKAVLDAAKTREAAINTELKALADKFNKDRAAGVAPALLQAQAAKFQETQEKAKAEMDKILLPVRLSDAYVIEQILDKREAVTKAAMSKSGVSLLLNPEAVQASNLASYSLDQQILAELNATLPAVQLVPPAGWQPRQVREQQAQQGGGAPAGGDGR